MENVKYRLDEILKEVDFNDLAKSLGVDVSIIYTWSRKEYIPSTENFIGISKYLDYSLEYLFCRTDDLGNCIVNKIDNFYNSLLKIVELRKTTIKKMKKDKIITANNLFKWKNGSVPTPETLIKLADYLSVSVDELLSVE